MRLTAYAPAIPTGPSGLMLAPVEVSTEYGMVQRVFARVAYAHALPRNGSIRIDGDLSDWPAGTANVMSDFALIGGSEQSMLDRETGRPKHKTLGFVLRDKDSLYVAVNCEADPGLQAASSRRNRVLYEDMIPMSGELVEVLIDPSNSGTRFPEDLYHVVVKRSGGDLVEKGVRFSPPCGRSAPWPVAIDLASSVAPERWVVEMRIPLEAFGSNATDHTLWGFNITRFDQTAGEFSTWSGAARNAYDPLSLGNLLLP